jgi:3-hydroxymyristoyl/3-hydroxydecanoyl-(acyl carrier protein) dehydratase
MAQVGGSKESFAGVDKVHFRKPVIAGDTLVMKMKLAKLNKRFGIAKMDGQANVGERRRIYDGSWQGKLSQVLTHTTPLLSGHSKLWSLKFNIAVPRWADSTRLVRHSIDF